jgi:hypothetical protein
MTLIIYAVLAFFVFLALRGLMGLFPRRTLLLVIAALIGLAFQLLSGGCHQVRLDRQGYPAWEEGE